MVKQRALLAIVGPTASGKTFFSLLLAKLVPSEIVSADSRQVYKYLTIGTAKPTEEERSAVPHHFIDILEPTQEYSAGQYGNEARECIQRVFERNKQPILVGGSGLYVRAVLDGLFEGVGKNEEIRRQLLEEANEHGAEWLYAKLQKIDPRAAATMDATKVRRIIRALEVYYLTGKPISYFHQTQQTVAPFSVMQIGLWWDRAELYNRIDHRVDVMFKQGFLDEVQWLRERGYAPSLNALNTVGYKEAYEYLDGRLSYTTMLDLIKRNTRRFAKRQLTWFRADSRIAWVQVSEKTDWDSLAREIVVRFQKHVEKVQ